MNDKLEKARKGDLETQRDVIDAIFNTDSFEQMMSQLEPDDEQWLRQLANESGTRWSMAKRYFLVTMRSR